MTLRPRDAATAGLSPAGLHRAAHTGGYERIARGLYRPAHAPAADLDWIEAATRRAEATICLTSALAHHDLIDTIPTTLDVAIPRGHRTPATTGAITWHHFDPATFSLGRTQITIPDTQETIGLYTAERSIADAFRLRGTIRYQLGLDALKEWLHRGGQPAHLLDLATQLPRTRQPLLQALQVILCGANRPSRSTSDLPHGQRAREGTGTGDCTVSASGMGTSPPVTASQRVGSV